MVRIRKNATRLLGSDYLIYPPLPPPPAESWDPHSSSSTPAAAEEGGEGGEVVLCRLNCSPWDVIGTDLEHLSCCFQEEGGAEGRGIMGNGLKFEEYEEILATFEAITSYLSSAATAAEEEVDLKSKDDDDDKKVKKRRKRKRKEEENGSDDHRDSKNVNVVAKSVAVVCSKNDGKGWHCKRPANPQHTLCNHHLDLLRNYSSRTNGSGHRESHDDSGTDDQPQVKTQRSSKSIAAAAAATDESAGDGVSVKSHRPKAVAAASAKAGDGYYYYYSGFGPWRGKKRSSGGTTSPRAAVDDDDDDDEKVEKRKDDSGDASDGPVAGDDLDDDDDDDDDVEGKGRIVKKKGRKRVKARSLKSLM